MTPHQLAGGGSKKTYSPLTGTLFRWMTNAQFGSESVVLIRSA
jgi:hypothetical protein